MRKIILLTVALIVTFGVFAKGPMTASAPSLAFVMGGFEDGKLGPEQALVSPRSARRYVPSRQAPPSTPVDELFEAMDDPALSSLRGFDAALPFSEHVKHIPVFEVEAVRFEPVFDAEGWLTLPPSEYSAPPEPELSRAAVVKPIGNASAARQFVREAAFTSELNAKTSSGRNTAPIAERHLTVRGNAALSYRKISVAQNSSASGRFKHRPAALSAVFGKRHVDASKKAEGDTFFSVLNALDSAAGPAAYERPATLGPAPDHSRSVSFSPAAYTVPAVEIVPARAEPVPVKLSTPIDLETFLLSAGPRAAATGVRDLPAIGHTTRVAANSLPLSLLLAEEMDGGVSERSNFSSIPDIAHSSSGPATARLYEALDTPFRGDAGSPAITDAEHSIFSPRAEALAVRYIAPPSDEAMAETTDRPAGYAAIDESVTHGGSVGWLSSLAETGPKIGLDTFDRPKTVPRAIAKRAAYTVTGLTTLNVEPMKRSDGNYCDPNFVGEPIRFSQTAELTLEDLLLQIHNRFGVNFLMGPNVGRRPINIKAGSIPWNVLLRSQFFVSGIRARCIGDDTIELVENVALPGLQDSAEVNTRFIKLKFLQRITGGSVDLANRSQGGQGGQGGCGGTSGGQGGVSGGGQTGGQSGETAGQQGSNKFDKLIIEIEKILGIRSMTESSVGTGGGGQGVVAQPVEERRTNRFVTQIPGRNILVIRATDEEHQLIDEIIARADRPPFQVVIKGLIYVANQDKLRDIGIQTTITGEAADRKIGGGIFGHTLGTGTLFDFSTIIGTVDFNVQATALQQNGVISIKSRPFATVLDGLCTILNVGRQIPIVIDSTLGGQGDVVFVDASNNLAVTPHVIDDEFGNPMAVTLELRLAANDVDSSVTARDIPAISQRSIQTQLLLGEDKTAILGGFTVDQDSRTVSKTPGLGDIPIIGELFKRRVRDTRVNRLYFAISASVIPFGEVIQPVEVPGATTDPPSITPEMKKRSDKAEPKQVTSPARTGP